jgi:solute carrier family 45, member 1/2/4
MPSSYAALPDSQRDDSAALPVTSPATFDGSTPRNASVNGSNTSPDRPKGMAQRKGFAKIAELISGGFGKGNKAEHGKDQQGPGAGDVPDDEQSPLLTPEGEGHGFIDRGPQAGTDNEEELQATKSVWWLLLLTISIGGLQIAWSVELSNGSPYLLSLGLSKSLMALVWIAGPLSGTLVQPYVGMLSDNCRIPWGKRKPFMIGGAAATVASLLMLAWTREIVSGVLSLFGADLESHGVKIAILVFAVIWVYILDFAINTVQAAIRAFIVDCAPTHQQGRLHPYMTKLQTGSRRC